MRIETRQTQTAADVIERTEGQTTLSIDDAAVVVGVSRDTLYRAAATNGEVAPGVPVLFIGRRRRVPRERLLAFARGERTPAG